MKEKMRELFIDELSKEDSIKVCARMIKRAVKLAHLCISFNNFNTPMEILSALFSPVMLSQEKAHSWEVPFLLFFIIIIIIKLIIK